MNQKIKKEKLNEWQTIKNKTLINSSLLYYYYIRYYQLYHAGDYHDRELQCQHEGGTCDFFFVCWMSNGLLQGSCGGILRGCCHRTAKSANLGINEIIDLTDLPNKDYGPVRNDASEWLLLNQTKS
jgi:hypothetical protein